MTWRTSDINSALEVLELSGDFDLDALEAAYAAKVRCYRPERDPLGFQRVREAFELLRECMNWSSRSSVQVPSSESGGAERREEPEPPEAPGKLRGRDSYAAFRETWRKALTAPGFEAARRLWLEISESEIEEGALRELGLFCLTSAFFQADRDWVLETWQFLASDSRSIDSSSESEFQLVELFASYRPKRTEMRQGHLLRLSLDEALVAWGDPDSRRAPSPLAGWFRAVSQRPFDLLAAFPNLNEALNLLPLVRFICHRAPDIEFVGAPKVSPETVARHVQVFCEDHGRLMRTVHIGERSRAEAERSVRRLSFELFLESGATLTVLRQALQRFGAERDFKTGWIRHQWEEDYALHFLDLMRILEIVDGEERHV